jgi:hypothetical protein
LGVVFVSGYMPDVGRLTEIPGAIFLPKPFTPSDLLRAVSRAIPRKPFDVELRSSHHSPVSATTT